ncbi:Integrase (fragment) (plasmid) [Methylocella tundrae]|uniref:Integrase n=1 Tax=Methylocella tundrae TaxID=227605 RepID=A0A4V6INB6_METTU
MGPRDCRSTVLTPIEDAMIVAFRQRTLLPLDDVMGCLRDSIPKLTRSSRRRCLVRHGVSRAGQRDDDEARPLRRDDDRLCPHRQP